MKKTKFLALVLVIAIMLVGAGYAAWTEQLKTTNIISTGELNVKFDKISATTPRIYYLSKDNPWRPDSQWDWRQAEGEDIAKADVDISDHELVYTFTDMYPGTRASGRYYMENVGTIPAVIQDVDVSYKTLDKGPDGKYDLLKSMEYTTVINVVDKDGNNKGHYYGKGILIFDLEPWLENTLKGIRLQPGDRVELGDPNGDDIDTQFNFEIPYDKLNGDAGELETVQIVISFDFVQHNMFDPNFTDDVE